MRFNHALLFMMGVAALGAFVLPPGAGNAFRKLDVLLWPVSSPVRRVAARFVAPAEKAQQRTPSAQRSSGESDEKLRDEIETLKFRVLRLTTENAELNKQLKAIAKIGLSADELVPATVFSGDPGNQQVLSVHPRSTEGLTSRMPVITPEKYLAGRLEIVGIGAARVRLITDRGSAVAAEFKRYKRFDGDFEPMPQAPKVVQGTGDGGMVVRGMKSEEVSPPDDKQHALAVGDWLVVSDRDLPPSVQGYKLGEIEAFQTAKNALFYNVIVRPETDLMKLREVMIVVKK
jgi:cell shape-determining protein MreC